MAKYFINCKKLADLRKEYIRLMKENHPDLVNDEEEKKRRHIISAEINNEYDILSKKLPKDEVTSSFVQNTVYDYIINGNKKAWMACEDIARKIHVPNIEYKYYEAREGVEWWESEFLGEIDATIRLFWEMCYAKKIVGEEFVKLYELCGHNAEKIKRVIMFLSTGVIAETDIHANLTSENAVPFFNDAITVENLPGYDSFFLLSKENTKRDTISAWIEFCQRQRDDFLERYYACVVPKITSEKQK